MVVSLHFDAIREIIKYLDAKNAFRFLTTCPRLYQLLLETNLVTTLNLDLSPSVSVIMPRLALECRFVTDLRIKGYKVESLPLLLSSLSSQLTNLELNCCNAIQVLSESAQKRSLTKSFPLLHSLRIGGRNKDSRGWDISFRGFPKSLTLLDAPKLTLHSSSINTLPKGLLHLYITILPLENYNVIEYSLPGNLQTFHATSHPLILPPMPSSLTSIFVQLSERNEWEKILDEVVCLKSVSLNLQTSTFGTEPPKIPDSVTFLKIRDHCDEKSRIWPESLPPQLTSLDWISSTKVFGRKPEGPPLAKLVRLIPDSVTYIRAYILDTIDEDIDLLRLPPNLTRWDGLKFDVRRLRSSKLGLRHLRLKHINIFNMASDMLLDDIVPPHVTELDVHTLSYIEDALEVFRNAKNLKTLRIAGSEIDRATMLWKDWERREGHITGDVDEGFEDSEEEEDEDFDLRTLPNRRFRPSSVKWHIPPCLTTFYAYVPYFLPRAEIIEWPPSITSASLVANGRVAHPEWFIRRLPERMDSVALETYDVHPSLLRIFPKWLRKLTVGTIGEMDVNHASFMPHAAKLEMYLATVQVRPNFTLAAFPRSITDLRLYTPQDVRLITMALGHALPHLHCARVLNQGSIIAKPDFFY